MKQKREAQQTTLLEEEWVMPVTRLVTLGWMVSITGGRSGSERCTTVISQFQVAVRGFLHTRSGFSSYGKISLTHWQSRRVNTNPPGSSTGRQGAKTSASMVSVKCTIMSVFSNTCRARQKGQISILKSSQLGPCPEPRMLYNSSS